MSSPSFEVIESAWWRFVQNECPHPINSRLRYQWMRDRSQFQFAGRTYQRRSRMEQDPDGSKVAGSRVTYTDIENQDMVIVGVIKGVQSVFGKTSLDLTL